MAKPPVNDLMRKRAASYVGPAQSTPSRVVNEVKGYTAQRAHEGLQTIRSGANPSMLDTIMGAMGVPVSGLKMAGGAMQTALSPVGGLGETLGHEMWPDPGDPRAGRLGSLAEAVTPVPGEKIAEGLNFTRTAANALLRRGGPVVRSAMEEASPVLRTLSGAPASPHQVAAASWEKVADLQGRQAAPTIQVAARQDALARSSALGIQPSGSAQDMVNTHLQYHGAPNRPQPVPPSQGVPRQPGLPSYPDPMRFVPS